MMWTDQLAPDVEGFAVGAAGAYQGPDWSVRVCLSCGNLVHPAFMAIHREKCTARNLEIDPLPEEVPL